MVRAASYRPAASQRFFVLPAEPRDALPARDASAWRPVERAVRRAAHARRILRTGQHRFHYNTPSKLLGNARTILVYLPLDYDKHPDQRYPVLYMQDGQNLFDESTSYAGVEWGLDEAAQHLIDAGKIKPLIIVGIYN